MSHTTPVSVVSGSLQSPRWPWQTRGGKSPRAFGVSTDSPCPAVSGLHIRLQNRFLTCWFLPFHMRDRAQPRLSVHPVTIGPPSWGAGQVTRVKVEPPTGGTTLTRGAWSARLAWVDGDRMNPLPTSTTPGAVALSPPSWSPRSPPEALEAGAAKTAEVFWCLTAVVQAVTCCPAPRARMLKRYLNV
jgi:hypothetical protein